MPNKNTFIFNMLCEEGKTGHSKLHGFWGNLAHFLMHFLTLKGHQYRKTLPNYPITAQNRTLLISCAI